MDKKDYQRASEMMNSYNESNDVNEIKTILIITQSFKEHSVLGEPRKRLVEIYDNKLKK